MYTAGKYVKGAKNFIKDIKQDVEFKVSQASAHNFKCTWILTSWLIDPLCSNQESLKGECALKAILLSSFKVDSASNFIVCIAF